ncbi:hypothetical protein [Nostoc sp. FACHB-892]|uniref:hypothetical protein n=1 Tax=Nostoc sp. FACHB-892 TaxID=2692843 RepID=UPI001A7E1CB7|nr:hypothetical protein [Nostoc sp. FACHB-892]
MTTDASILFDNKRFNVCQTRQSTDDSRHPLHPIGRICRQLSKFVISTFSNSSITPRRSPLLPKGIINCIAHLFF